MKQICMKCLTRRLVLFRDEVDKGGLIDLAVLSNHLLFMVSLLRERRASGTVPEMLLVGRYLQTKPFSTVRVFWGSCRCLPRNAELEFLRTRSSYEGFSVQSLQAH
jgi:hypothetical protein